MGAILNSGACASVVGKVILDNTLKAMKLLDIPDGTIARESHQFGNHPEKDVTFFDVKYPFQCHDDNDDRTSQYNIVLDVIDEKLPFLVGLPTLLSMPSIMNLRFRSLGLQLDSKYMHIPLTYGESDLELSFSSTIECSKRAKPNPLERVGRNHSDQQELSHYQPPPGPSRFEDVQPTPPITHESSPATEEQYKLTNPTVTCTPLPGTYSPSLLTKFDPDRGPPPSAPRGPLPSSHSRDFTMQHAPDRGPPSSAPRGPSSSSPARDFTSAELTKLHVQLQHASLTHICDYINSDNL